MNPTEPGETSPKPRFRGIIPPMVTPLLSYDELDVEGTKRLVNHLIEGGVSGLFILGTTGEAQSLSYRLRGELIDLVSSVVDKRVPVLVGITDTAFAESVALALQAYEHEADAVVLTTPYYFPVGQTELRGYVSRLLEELPLPLVLYNMPSLTKVWFEIETLKILADDERIIGIKDSSGDLDYFRNVVEMKSIRPDWSVLMGPEAHILEALQMGADGGVPGGANPFPHIFSGLHRAFVENDVERMADCQQQIEALQQVYEIGKYGSRFVKATKSALGILGICQDTMAEPFNHFLEPERKRVAEIVKTIQPG